MNKTELNETFFIEASSIKSSRIICFTIDASNTKVIKVFKNKEYLKYLKRGNFKYNELTYICNISEGCNIYMGTKTIRLKDYIMKQKYILSMFVNDKEFPKFLKESYNKYNKYNKMIKKDLKCVQN